MRDWPETAGPMMPSETAGILPVEAEGLVYETGGRRLVAIDRLSLGPGGPTMILGPNGAGKSLLLRLLHGLIEPSAGRVLWAGAPATAAVRRRQAMVFQRPVLLRRSVEANVDYALRIHGLPKRERRARVEAALAAGGLSGLARQPARTLSGGEQQRLAVVRALAVRPQLLFLDEPTASLDPASTHAIERLLQAAARQGTKIVMVTHDTGQAKRLGREVVFLHRGHVVEQSGAGAFFERPGSREARAFLAGELLI